MDTRTITSVFPSAEPGRFTMALSDGTSATVADFIDSPEGIRVEIRNDDGSLSGDGPILSDEIRAQFVALGVEGIPTHAPVIVLPPAEAAAPAEAAPVAPVVTPALVLNVEQHEASKSLADEIEEHIPEVVKEAWAKLRALLHHL